MKNLFFITLSLISGLLSAQNKHDQHWLFGTGSLSLFETGGTLIEFASPSLKQSFFPTDVGFMWDKSAVSDRMGNLVAFTNGCQIFNKDFDVMDGGDGINEGPLHDLYCGGAKHYVNPQGALFLTWPGSDSLYALVHLRNALNGSRDLLFSVVDGSANAGTGKVLDKNQLLLTDTLVNLLTACRHANGRDWWVVVMKNLNPELIQPNLPYSGTYHFYLLSPGGFQYQGVQQTANQFFSTASLPGQSSFSPNGQYYAIGNPNNGINPFDFDRCSGQLTNPRHINIKPDTTQQLGLAFSPSSRFLYVATRNWIDQYDMEVGDIEASKIGVARHNNSVGLAGQLTKFFQLGLAPDGKIYGTSIVFSDKLNIIHHPDLKGAACGVQQNGIQLLTGHMATVPNFPYYRLYDIPSSPCDTLGIDGISSVNNLRLGVAKLYPNPSTGTVHWTGAEGQPLNLRAFNALGQLVAERRAVTGSADLSALAPGVYRLEFSDVNNWSLKIGNCTLVISSYSK